MLVIEQEQPKFKLDGTYRGPYRVYEVTDTNANIKPVTEPDGEARCVSLKKISKVFPLMKCGWDTTKLN